MPTKVNGADLYGDGKNGQENAKENVYPEKDQGHQYRNGNMHAGHGGDSAKRHEVAGGMGLPEGILNLDRLEAGNRS
jgi:hypothetical protein